LPLILSFQIEADFIRSPIFVGIFIIGVASLMISRLPTFAFKSGRIQHRYVLLTMLIVGLIAAMAVSTPWLTLTVVLGFYLMSIPFGQRAYARLEKQAGELDGEEYDEDIDD
jgi:CDP-diacylglycerol--serine O-phosphatidyltransferase